MTTNGKSYSVWRYGSDVRLYEIQAESEAEAQALIEKYPYISHRIIFESQPNEPLFDSVSYIVLKNPESKEELLEIIFGKKRKKTVRKFKSQLDNK